MLGETVERHRVAARQIADQLLEGFFRNSPDTTAFGGHDHLRACCFEQFRRNLLVELIVVLRQHPHALYPARLCWSTVFAESESGGETERAAGARFAFDRDAASHHL